MTLNSSRGLFTKSFYGFFVNSPRCATFNLINCNQNNRVFFETLIDVDYTHAHAYSRILTPYSSAL